jgi:two-component system response regulator AtoC
MNRKQEKDSTRRDEFYEENQRFSEEGSTGFHWLTRDPQMLHIRRLADKLAKVEVPVLIIGESGTGKEVMSRYIHHQSLRRSQPFIAVNCAAIPSELVESELFGFEKGAFSGAHAMKPGAFELADGGTLFLDEIGEMPLQVQSKLLRAVEHHQFSSHWRKTGGKGRYSNSGRNKSAGTSKNRESGVSRRSFLPPQCGRNRVTTTQTEKRGYPLFGRVLFAKICSKIS